ncbi:MAG: hypothetical protein CVU57_13895 [Deltaproteobacteria bacterium HGW-Deltaproteobacteria-15]|nr:MAG: hypothetical protein CVU57_13895 [Deltaproteobacteria bacterium HGW-Deltaproteobacteria-15]
MFIRSIVTFMALVVLAGVSSSHAGMIDPNLENRLRAAGPNERIPVIVTFSEKADIEGLKAKDKRVRRSRIIRSLKQRHEESARKSSVVDIVGKTRADRREAGMRPLWLINGVALKVRPHVIRALAAKPSVNSVRLDQTIQAPSVNVAVDALPEWNLAAIHAPDLWSIGHTGEGVVIACVDTGVDVDHPDLVTRWRGGSNSWFDANDPEFNPLVNNLPYDLDGHGTGVMGILVGGNEGGTDIGVAPGAKWIAAKIFNADGEALESEIHAAFQWLLDPDGDPETDDAPDIINNSWGYGQNPDVCIEEIDSISFRSDLQVLKQAGIAVVFSAGNNGPSPYTSQSPANYPESFSVGASDESPLVANFSSRGPSACDGGVFPHVVAPGVRTAYPYGIKTADLYLGAPNAYAYYAGTSFSAPHAAGAMALLLSAFPNLTPYQLETAMKVSAVDLGPAGLDNESGHGLMNAMGAFAAVQNFDHVTITAAIFDPAAETLMVIATSTAQPNVTLTGEGFGDLEWKSWKEFYRKTFTGVTDPPQTVTVVSSGGGSATVTLPGMDTVSLTGLTYDPQARALTVIATSSDQPNVTLTAEGLGTLEWKSWKEFYRNTFYGIADPPVEVTVSSSGGGSDTAAVPRDTVSITGLSYDAEARTLMVIATSTDQPDVTLSAEGFGALEWKSWLNLYRKTFAGVDTLPGSVRVVSSGGGSDEGIVSSQQ